jgi:hypothetical protein
MPTGGIPVNTAEECQAEFDIDDEVEEPVVALL